MQTLTIRDVTHPYTLAVALACIFAGIMLYNIYCIFAQIHRKKVLLAAKEEIIKGHTALVGDKKVVIIDETGQKLTSDLIKNEIQTNSQALKDSKPAKPKKEKINKRQEKEFKAAQKSIDFINEMNKNIDALLATIKTPEDIEAEFKISEENIEKGYVEPPVLEEPKPKKPTKAELKQMKLQKAAEKKQAKLDQKKKYAESREQMRDKVSKDIDLFDERKKK